MCTFFFVYVVYRILDILFIKSVYLIPGVPCNWCTFIWCTLYLVYLYLMYLVPGVLCTWCFSYLVYLLPCVPYTWFTLYLLYLVPDVPLSGVPCTWCTLYLVFLIPAVPCTWCTCSIWWLGSSARKVLKGWVICAMILFSILNIMKPFHAPDLAWWTCTCISCTRPCRGGCTGGRGLRWPGWRQEWLPSVSGRAAQFENLQTLKKRFKFSGWNYPKAKKSLSASILSNLRNSHQSQWFSTIFIV